MKILGVEEFTESNKIWRMLCAEFLGAFSLLFFGCGTIMTNIDPTVLVVQVALTFGLTIAVLAQSIGHVSGCHINPAVTLSFLVVGKCSILKSLCYIVLQCAGAAAGFYVLLLLSPAEMKATPNLGNTFLGEHVTASQGLGIEICATFLLCFVIHSVCDERRSDVKMIAPLLIGISAVVCHLFAIKYTGSSLNPARSFGPSVVYGKWENHWIYWAGPIIGGCVASVVYKLLFQVRKGEEETSSYDFS